MENDVTIRIKLYRNIMGVRTPYDLVLDGRRNVVSEQVDQEELSRSSFREPRESDFDSQTSPMIPQVGMGWFIYESANPFPGTEILRADYFRRVKEVEDEHAAKGTTCPDCVLGSIIGEFKVLLREKGFQL